jgi:hypothetical protein
LGERDERRLGAKFVGCRPGRGWDVGQPVNDRGDRFAVSFEGGTFVVGEVELLKHLADPVFDGQ